jgi:hypothetical protein
MSLAEIASTSFRPLKRTRPLGPGVTLPVTVQSGPGVGVGVGIGELVGVGVGVGRGLAAATLGPVAIAAPRIPAAKTATRMRVIGRDDRLERMGIEETSYRASLPEAGRFAFTLAIVSSDAIGSLFARRSDPSSTRRSGDRLSDTPVCEDTVRS